MNRYLILLMILLNIACARHDVDDPEFESVPTLNALLVPGEPLEIEVHPTGTMSDIKEDLPVKQSFLYEDGIPVDTFLYVSDDTIQRGRSYRLVVELEDGNTLIANCETYPELVLQKASVTALQPPVVEGDIRYNWEYKIFIEARKISDEVHLLFRPVEVDTVYNFGDSTVRDIHYNSWAGSIKLPPVMTNQDHFTLPGNFSDTLTFLSSIPGTVRFARISPVLMEAFSQSYRQHSVAETMPVSASNVEGGTGICFVI